jgi:hypothetical protein
MTTNGSRHAKRFGELLIDEGLITQDQLDEALRLQRDTETYQPLGQILVSRGWVTRSRLVGVLRRHRNSVRLGDLLVRARGITPEQLQVALAHAKTLRQPFGQSLRTLGFVTEEALREALCSQLHINFFDLDNIRPSAALAKLINERYATRRRLVPLFRVAQTLVVAMDDPADIGTIEELQQTLGLRVEVVTSTAGKIRRAIQRLYGRADDPPADPTQASAIIGIVRDQEVADLAVLALGVRMRPTSRPSAADV